MRKKIIEALKNRYRNLGFSEKAFDGVAAYIEPSIKEESEIETAIGGVEALLKAFQGEADSLRTAKSAAEKKLAELEAKIKEMEDGEQKPAPAPKPAPTPKPKEGEETPAWAKALIEANKALNDRLNKMDSERTTKARKQQLSEIVSKLPETLRKPYERIALDSLKEDEFTSMLSEVTTEVDGALAELKSKGAVFGRPVGSGAKKGEGDLKEATDAEAQAVVDRLAL